MGISNILFLLYILLLSFCSITFAWNEKWLAQKIVLNKVDVHYLSVEAVDIDFDGDIDLFFGTGDGLVGFYENIGTPEKYLFKLKKSASSKGSSFLNISTYDKAIPRFIDIDGDNDLDLFIGNNEGNIAFFRNDGDINEPNFVKIKDGKDIDSSYFNINVGLSAAPFFVDIDNDGDYDLFIGNAQGYIAFYKNEGNSTTPKFIRVYGGFAQNDSYNKISVGAYSIPVFTDINNDDRYDLFIGNFDGFIYYYKNIGSPKKPKFKLISKQFGKIEVGGDAAICFADFNNDGIDEIIVGNNEGRIFVFRHPGARKVVQLVKIASKTRNKNKNKRKDEDELDKILLKKAQSLVDNEEYIEAIIVLNKLKHKTEKSRDLKKFCKKEIEKLYKRLREESLLFSEVEKYFKNGIRYYIDEKYEKSIKQFEKVLSTVPTHHITITYKKRAHKKILAQKKAKEAKSYYNQALSEYKKGNIKKAFEFIKKAHLLNKEDIEYFELYTQYSNEYSLIEREKNYNEGIVRAKDLIAHRKYSKAMEILIPLKEQFPEDEELEKLIRICKKNSLAIKRSYNKRMKEKYLKKGDFYFNKNDFKNALKYYRLAKKYAYSDKEIARKIKLTQLKIRKKEKRRLDPRAVKRHFQNGLKFYSMGQYEKAIREWQKVLEIDPQHIMARKNIKKAKKMLNK